MFNNQDTYYFASIRKITAAFGTMFTSVQIRRFAGVGGVGDVVRTIQVPLAYAETQKWLNHMKEDVNAPLAYSDPANRKKRVRTSLPRMSFELTNLQYDPARKLQTLHAVTNKSDADINKLLKQLVPVPYDIAYDLNIGVQNIDDGLQILEQILPNFTPSFNLTVKDIPELGITRDVPIIFGGITKQDTYEGAYDEERLITWTLSFVAKGYIYPAIRDSGLIRTVTDNIYSDTTMENKIVEEIITVDPYDAAVDESWEAKTEVFDAPDGLDSNGDPVI